VPGCSVEDTFGLGEVLQLCTRSSDESKLPFCSLNNSFVINLPTKYPNSPAGTIAYLFAIPTAASHNPELSDDSHCRVHTAAGLTIVKVFNRLINLSPIHVASSELDINYEVEGVLTDMALLSLKAPQLVFYLLSCLYEHFIVLTFLCCLP